MRTKNNNRLSHACEWTARHWESVVLHALTLAVIICLMVLVLSLIES